MIQLQATWDGKRWVTPDKRWVWTGREWVAFSSTLRLAPRIFIYAAAGVVLNVPAFFVLALTWGLTGPAWDANPPDVWGSIVQLAVTAICAVGVFGAGWFLIRVDRRDWWLGILLAWPWIASAAALALLSDGSFSALLLSACLTVAAVLPTAGPIFGRWQRWPTGRSTASEQLKSNPGVPERTPVAEIDWPALISELEAIAAAELGDRSEPLRSILSRAQPSLEGVTDAIAQVEKARIPFVDPIRIGDLAYSMRVLVAERTGGTQPPRGGRALWSGELSFGTPVGCTPVVLFAALLAVAVLRS